MGIKKEEGYGGAKMYTLRHEVPQLRRSMCFGMPLGIPYGTKCPSSEGACVKACPWVYLLNTFKRFHATQVGGNFPFPQLGMEFNDKITSNN